MIFWLMMMTIQIGKNYSCAELSQGLEREMARSHTLPVPIQVLTTLGFLATGTFQRELADRSGMSHAALSHAMPTVRQVYTVSL